MPNTLSELKLISYGVIGEMKIRDDAFFKPGTVLDNSLRDDYSKDGRYVEIVPMEWLPSATATVTKTQTNYIVKGVDKNGTEYSASVLESMTIPARWMPHGSNRVTAPDVRIGERVEIWQFGSTDRYYWTEIGMDDTLRKLETVVWAISATTDESDQALDVDNTYYLSMSSQDKKITLSTSAVNGEPYRYNFEFDTEIGTVTLKDTDNNSFVFDTSKTSIKFLNREGTFTDINLKDYLVNAPGYIRTTSKNQTIMTSGELFRFIMPTADFGDKGLEPAVKGDKWSDWAEALEKKLDEHKHIGNLGCITSTAKAVAPFALSSHWTKTSGTVFSKVYRHF